MKTEKTWRSRGGSGAHRRGWGMWGRMEGYWEGQNRHVEEYGEGGEDMGEEWRICGRAG